MKTDEERLGVPKACDFLFRIAKRLPSDSVECGGELTGKDDENHGDCSHCRFYLRLSGELYGDWGVCANARGPRAGLLTFEHQAGFGCYKYDRD